MEDEFRQMLKDAAKGCEENEDGCASSTCIDCIVNILYKAGYRRVTNVEFQNEYIIVKEYNNGGLPFRSEAYRTVSRDKALKMLETYSHLDGIYKLYWRLSGELLEIEYKL